MKLFKSGAEGTRRTEQSRSGSKRSIAGIFIFAVLILAAIFAMSLIFRITAIEVIGNEHYTDAEIINAIDIEEGDNLFFFDRFATISRVFAKLPYVEQVSVERSLSGRVVVTVSECKAMAYIKIGEEEWTIDHNCKVLGKATEDELGNLIPVLGFDPGTLFIGEELTQAKGDSDAVEYLAEILYQIQYRGMTSSVKRIDYSDYPSVKFSYGNMYSVILGPHKDTEHKFGMFVSVLSKLKSGDFGIVDVSDGGSQARFTPN